MTKPWENPSFLNGVKPEVYIPADLDGVLELIDALIDVTKWRQAEWKKMHPGHEDDIDSVIGKRLLRLSNIASFLKKFKAQSPSEHERELTFELINIGMTLHHETYSWAINIAEKGVAQEAGLDKSAKNRRVTAEEWKERQALAIEAVRVHGRKKAPKELEISPRQLAIWLKRGER